MPTSAPRACRVCRRALAHHIPPDGPEFWDHYPSDSLQGHRAVPVDAEVGFLRGRCDFCTSDLGSEIWILPVADFLAGLDPTTGRMQGYQDDWSACGECASLIDGNRWSALVRRTQEVWETAHGIPAPPGKVTGWSHLYRLVRRHIRGSLRPPH
jgi:hypothetical protein